MPLLYHILLDLSRVVLEPTPFLCYIIEDVLVHFNLYAGHSVLLEELGFCVGNSVLNLVEVVDSHCVSSHSLHLLFFCTLIIAQEGGFVNPLFLQFFTF